MGTTKIITAALTLVVALAIGGGAAAQQSTKRVHPFPAAIEDATSFVREAGMTERIALAVVDIAELGRTTVELGDVDAATAFFVLHEVLYRGRDVLVNALRDFRARYPGASPS